MWMTFEFRSFGKGLSLLVSVVIIAVGSFAIASCGNKDNGDAETETEVNATIDHEIDSVATTMYNYYIEGKYDEYVNQVESNDKKPASYRDQMAILHKMRHRQQEEENGGPVRCRLVRFESHGDDYGTAFLEVTFKDNSRETVLQQMVKVNGRWRIR